MKLPKIQTPVYKTKLISNNKQVMFRPFLVKEEKILLTCMQTQDTDTIIENYIQVLKNCILEKNLKIEELASFDAIHLFIELRKKSIGEIIDISVKDTEIGKFFDVEMDLNEIQIIKNKEINNKIQLDENIGIILKYPTIKEALNLILDKNQEINSTIIIEILLKCIDKIYDKENVYDAKNYSQEELLEFIDQLSPSMMKLITEFFENMPKIFFEKEYVSPFSKEKVKVKIENFIDFLI